MTSIEIPESKLHALKNKVVIVTGGASGIGTSMVKLYHSYGAKVIVGDVQDKQGEALVGEFNSNRPVYVHCDVTSWKDQLNLFDVALQKYGTIDVVYVNAGIGEVEDLFLDTVDADGKLCEPKYIVNEINFKGALATIKIAIHHFRRLGIKGSIVVTTSTAGYMGEPICGYTAAKHGLVGVMRALRDNLHHKFGIRLNTVAPWMTETPLGDVPGLRETLAKLNLTMQDPISVAKAGALLGVDETYNGKTIYVANDTFTEIEEVIMKLEPQWLGKENSELFSRGRTEEGRQMFTSKSGL